MIDIGETYPSTVLDYHRDLDIHYSVPLGNMSLCRLKDGNMLLCIRQFNYAISNDCSKHYFFSDFLLDKDNYLIIVDSDFKFIESVPCNTIRNHEDVRLLRYDDNIIQMSGTDTTYDKRRRVFSYHFKISDDYRLEYINGMVFPGMKEKNYIPVEDKKGIYISNIRENLLKIVDMISPSNKVRHQCIGAVPYRGSSQMMCYGDEYVALVHRREGNFFYNAFAFFDKALLQCRISDEFTVFSKTSPINFCCGMAIEDDMAILPVCVHDRWTHLFRIPLQDFSKTARWRS